MGGYYEERRAAHRWRMHSLVQGLTAGNERLYQTSAEFKTWVDAMAEHLLGLSDRMADAMARVEARREEVIEELMHREPVHVSSEVLRAAARLGADEARGG